jgi:hypothetical protein
MPVFTPVLFLGSMRMAFPGCFFPGGFSGSIRLVCTPGGAGLPPAPTAAPRAGADPRTPWGPQPE